MDLRIRMASAAAAAGVAGAEVAIEATRTVHRRTIPHRTTSEAVALPLPNQTPDVATNLGRMTIATAPADAAVEVDVVAVETTKPARASAREAVTTAEAIAVVVVVATTAAAIAAAAARAQALARTLTAGVASPEMVTSATRSLNGVNVLSSVAVAVAVVASAHAVIHSRRHCPRTSRSDRWIPAARATFCPAAVGARIPSAQPSVSLSAAPAP
jgi:hypothetical protein